jgi:septal ring factor EnvC (AmiA/AmiB activator)
MARFGTDRPEGGIWRGILIKAAEGASIQAVGGGTVVYANWLRGFGNLLILDHGEQYLSIYAYNQSLLKQVGDTVRTGEAVALAGSTGGQLDSALYFEIRHRGTAVDPLTFLSR